MLLTVFVRINLIGAAEDVGVFLEICRDKIDFTHIHYLTSVDIYYKQYLKVIFGLILTSH